MATICILHSSDIDMTMLDETSKDYIYRLLSIDELKIFKKDYLVEVLGVLLSI